MLRTGTRRTVRADLRCEIPYVGDNLDRLLGLLQAARDEAPDRCTAEREASYRALAAAIVAPLPVVVRTCA